MERRQHPRVKTNKFISYRCINGGDRQTKEGKGKSVNISQGGILIETHDAFEWQDILLLTLDIEGESVSVKGKVIYCNADNFGKYRTGIQFLETNEKIILFVKKLLKTYSEILGIT